MAGSNIPSYMQVRILFNFGVTGYMNETEANTRCTIHFISHTTPTQNTKIEIY